MYYYYALFTESNDMDNAYTTDRYSMAVFLSQRRNLNDVFTNDTIIGCKNFQDEVEFIQYIAHQYGVILTTDNYIDIVVSHADGSKMVAVTSEEMSQLAMQEDDLVVYRIDMISKSLKWFDMVLPFTKILSSYPNAASLMHSLSGKLDIYGKLILYLLDHATLTSQDDNTDTDLQCELWNTLVYDYPEVDVDDLQLTDVLDYFFINVDLVYSYIDVTTPWGDSHVIDIERWWTNSDAALRVFLWKLPRGGRNA